MHLGFCARNQRAVSTIEARFAVAPAMRALPVARAVVQAEGFCRFVAQESTPPVVADTPGERLRAMRSQVVIAPVKKSRSLKLSMTCVRIYLPSVRSLRV